MKSFKQFLAEEEENKNIEENDPSDGNTPVDAPNEYNPASDLMGQIQNWSYLPGKDIAKGIDNDYKLIKWAEDDAKENNENPPALTSKEVNPHRVKAEDDYDYWKDAIVGKNSDAETEKFYDWMWRSARQDQYPWEKEKGEEYERRGQGWRQGIKPKDYEFPIQPKEKPFDFEDSEGLYDSPEDQEVRDAVKGLSKEDSERIINQAKEDRKNG